MIPDWLSVSDAQDLIPDVVVRDPMTAEVWEILAAKYTASTRSLAQHHPSAALVLTVLALPWYCRCGRFSPPSTPSLPGGPRPSRSGTLG